MPYRRLPNTDQARLRAMKKALAMGEKLSLNEMGISNETYQKLKVFLPKFEHALISQKEAYSNQVKNSNQYKDAFKKVKLFLSHFVQVMNFAILRHEFKPSIRIFYGIDENDSKVPVLNTETEVIEWGKKIIKGEEERVMKGGMAVLNPKISVVKVRYERFLEAFHFQKTLQDINNRALNKVSKLREEADAIILLIWNEVEARFNNLPSIVRREKCINYGITYVYRKNEKKLELNEHVTI